MANKAATKAKNEGELKPNFFMRIGLFIKQIIVELRKVVAPTRGELFRWTVAVLIFVVLLMIFVTALDFGLGKLVFWLFG